MLRRIIFALLLIWPVGASAIDLPGWLKGMPPKEFMNRWIEAPYNGINESHIFSLRQLDQLLRDKMGGDMKYDQLDEGVWKMSATLKAKNQRNAQQLGETYVVAMIIGPGRFQDTMQVREMTMAGQQLNATNALDLMTAWAQAIKHQGIQ